MIKWYCDFTEENAFRVLMPQGTTTNQHNEGQKLIETYKYIC